MQEKKISNPLSRRDLIKVLTAAFGLSLATPLLASCANKEPEEYEVDIVLQQSKIYYSPALITIPSGAKVTWLNKSYYSQSVTCDPKQAGNTKTVNLPPNAQAWDSGLLYPGQRFSKVFDISGTYIYFSLLMLSPNTVGTIVVK